MADGAIEHDTATYKQADDGAEHQCDGEPFGDRGQSRGGRFQEGRVDDDAWNCGDDCRGLCDVCGRKRSHHEFPYEQMISRRSAAASGRRIADWQPASPSESRRQELSRRGFAPPRLFLQRAKCCSIINPTRISPTPINPMIRIEANTPPVSKFCDAPMMSWPSPVDDRKIRPRPCLRARGRSLGGRQSS